MMTTCSTTAASSFNRPNLLISSSSSSSPDFINVSKKLSSTGFFGAKSTPLHHHCIRRTISCEVALKSDSTPSSSSSAHHDDHNIEEQPKIGARVRVTAPLKVYHVPRVPEIDLTGMEGKIKQYVALWKGKRISANLPYKVEFFAEIEGRGSVKFFAHLKEDEFEYLPSN